VKTTTVKIDPARREILKDAAYDVSMETREIVSMSDVMKFLIDNYTKEAVIKMKADTKV